MPQPRSRPNLRERIVDAAVDLLRKHGHRRLSQPQVARASGIPQGHLTYYFPRRADLLVAVARRSIERVGREIAALPLGFARAHIADLVGFIVKDRPRTRMLLALLVEAGDDPALRKMMVEGAIRVRGMLAATLGIDSEHPDATIALATLWGLGLQHLLLQDEGDDDAQTEALLHRLTAWLEAAPRDAGS